MRFRKGKKAYKLGRKGKSFNRYNRYLAKIEVKKRIALKAVQSAVITAMGHSQLAFLQATKGIEPVTKAMKAMEIAINTAQGISRVWSDTNRPFNTSETLISEIK